MCYSEAIEILQDTVDWLKEKKGVKLPMLEKRIESLEFAVNTLNVINKKHDIFGDDMMKVKEAATILEGVINGKV